VWLTLVLRIPENPGLNLDPEAGYPVSDFYWVFFSPFRKMIDSILNYAMISFFPILSQSLFTNRPIIPYYTLAI
jgi:hypothetical protein